MQFKSHRSRYQSTQQSTDVALHRPFYGGVMRSKWTLFVRHWHMRHDITCSREYDYCIRRKLHWHDYLLLSLFTQAYAIGRESGLVTNVLAQNYSSANRGIFGAIDLALKSLCVIVEPDTKFIEVSVTAFNRPFEVSLFKSRYFIDTIKNDNRRRVIFCN